MQRQTASIYSTYIWVFTVKKRVEFATSSSPLSVRVFFASLPVHHPVLYSLGIPTRSRDEPGSSSSVALLRSGWVLLTEEHVEQTA